MDQIGSERRIYGHEGHAHFSGEKSREHAQVIEILDFDPLLLDRPPALMCWPEAF
jgi:hypothetical protein